MSLRVAVRNTRRALLLPLRYTEDVMGSSFQNRAQRYELRVPVEFLAEGRIVTGNCINISESGALATFEHPLELWTTGELRLHSGRSSCKISARVARVIDREVGLAFRIDAETSDASLRVIHSIIEEARRQGETFRAPF